MSAIYFWILGFILFAGWQAQAESVSIVKLKPGLVYRVSCSGKLLVSSVGDNRILQLSALPKEIGCGVLLKASELKGTTNVVLETTVQSISKLVSISESGEAIHEKELRLDWSNSKDRAGSE